MDEFPLGVQIYGVRITGKIDIPDVRVTKVIAVEHCYVDAPIVATDCRFITFSLIGSIMRRAIDMRGSSFEGSLFLRNGFRSEEAILLRDTRITATIDCSKAAFFYNRSATLDPELTETVAGECFSFARSTAAALYWKEMQERPDGFINLRNCRIGSFRDDIDTSGKLERDWPPAPCLRIAGLKYDERTTNNSARLAGWLALQNTADPEEKPYSAYQAAIKTLLDNGHDLDADKMILAKQRLIAANDRNLINKLLRYAYIWLSDAGINASRILRITAVFFVLSVGAVMWLDATGGFAPKSNEILKENCYKAPANCQDPDWVTYRGRKLPKYYPPFNPLGYSLDLIVPVLSFGTSADWRPVSNPAIWASIVIRTIGMVCWGLVVFCLSGLARFSR